MAIWQYEMRLTFSLTTERQELSHQVSEILPESTSWHAKLRIWGKDPGDTIEMWDDCESPELWVRVDLREPNPEFLRAVLSLAERLGGRLATEYSDPLEPTVGKVLEDIAKSDAFRFVCDPQKFLSGLDE